MYMRKMWKKINEAKDKMLKDKVERQDRVSINESCLIN